MSSLRVGYAWTSLFGDDAEGQRTELLALGVAADRVYLDVGLVGMTRPRPALAEALAALRRGDTLVVTALFRLARSTTDAVDLLGRLVGVEVALAVGDVRQPLQGPALRMLVDGLEVQRSSGRRGTADVPGTVYAPRGPADSSPAGRRR